MLTYSTLTFINDPKSFWTVCGKGEKTVIMGDGEQVELPESTQVRKFVVDHGPELWSDDKHRICKVFINKASCAAPAEAEIKLDDVEEDKIYRIALYIRITNNNSSMYSNDWVFKGKPLYIEFSGTKALKDGKPAEYIAKMAKKHMLLVYGEDLVKFTVKDEKTLVVTAKNQWQIFMNQDHELAVALQVLTPITNEYDVTETVLSTVRPFKFVDIENAVTINSLGVEAFGDFAHVTKDLRLPTGANNRWYGIAAGDVMNGQPNDDRPNPGVMYTQFTVVYDSKRGIQQGDALGGLAKSRTTHVFYVADDDPVIATEVVDGEGKLKKSLGQSYDNGAKLGTLARAFAERLADALNDDDETQTTDNVFTYEGPLVEKA